MLGGLASAIDAINLPTLAIGIPATLFLFWVRKGLKLALVRLGLSPRAADISAKAVPVVAVALMILAVIVFDLGEHGVNLEGAIPQGLPDRQSARMGKGESRRVHLGGRSILQKKTDTP